MVAVQRWNGFDDIPADLGPTVVTLGNFDGVHRGHREVLGRVVREAAERGATPVAVTFEPHPVAVLHPGRAPEMVMSVGQRLDALADVGLGAVLVIAFTREYAQQTPQEFVRRTFVDALGACAVVVGKDTRFGVRNSGDVQTLRELGAEHGFEVIALEDIGEGARWSSTQLRSELLGGAVSHAAEILGRPHQVASGAGRCCHNRTGDLLHRSAVVFGRIAAVGVRRSVLPCSQAGLAGRPSGPAHVLPRRGGSESA